MSSISGLNAYTNALYLQGQANASTEGTNAQGRTQNLASSLLSSRNTQSQPGIVNLLSQQTNASSGSTLTEQISSLVKLTRFAMDSMGLSADSRVTFSQLKKYSDQVQERFSSAVEEGLENVRVDPANLTYTLDANGILSAHSASMLNESLAQKAIDDGSELGAGLLTRLAQAGVDLNEGFSFSLDAKGTIRALGDSAAWQSTLDAAHVTFPTLAQQIASEQIDPKIGFSLKTEDEVVKVNCGDPKYTEILQAFFDENPSIVADYKRTEALSGIEDVRKFMRLSPSDMRTRLQLESMAAWWDNSGQSQATSSFGTYNGGIFSRLNGINLSV